MSLSTSPEFDQDLNKLLQQHLPQVALTAVLEKIKSITKLEDKIEQLEANLIREKNQVAELQTKVSNENKLLVLKANLDSRETAVTLRERDCLDRENKYEVAHAVARANAAEDKCKAIFDLTQVAFRTPTKVLSFNETSSIPMAVAPSVPGNGGYGSPGFVSTGQQTVNQTTKESLE